MSEEGFVPQPRWGIRSAILWSYVMMWGSRGIAALTTFVLAALLSPEDFGILGLALAYLAFIRLFVEQGLTAALIQRKQLSEDHLNSAFWMSVGLSLVLSGLGIVLRGRWAELNQLPRLNDVILVLSIVPVFVGLSVVQEAVLQREMNFRALALRGILTAILGGAVGVGMALAGFGVWALVGQALVRSATDVAVLWAASEWRPRRRFSWPRLRELIGFSLNMLLGTIGFFIGNYVATVVLGIFYGAAAVGFFRFADRVVGMGSDLLSQPLSKVALPRLSRQQGDPDALGRSILDFTRLVSWLILPAMFLLAATSDRITALVGDKWAQSADVIKVLCLVAIGGGITRFTGPLLRAVSRPDIDAWFMWAFAVANVGAILGAALAMRNETGANQALGIAAAYAGVNIVIFVPASFLLVRRWARVPITRIVAAVLPGLASGVLVGGVASALDGLGVVSPLPRIPALGVLVLVSGAAGLILLYALDSRFRALVGRYRPGVRGREAGS